MSVSGVTQGQLYQYLFEPFWIYNELTNTYQEELLNLRLVGAVEYRTGGEKYLITVFGERFRVLNYPNLSLLT